MKLKTLLIVVLVLAAAYFILEFADGNKKESTIISSILTADTAAIDAILFYPEMMNKQEVKLVRESDGWYVASGDTRYVADKSNIQMILTQLSATRVDQLVGTKEDDWSKFDLTADKANNLVIQGGGKELASIFLGGFDYNEQTQQPSTYVRVKGDKNSYSVSGYLTGTFDRDLSGFRKRSITELDAKTFTKVEFLYPADSSFTLSKNNDVWFKNFQACDSTAVASYIQSISRLGSTGFINEAIDLTSLSKDYTIRIEGDAFETVELYAFTGHPVYSTIITASSHPDGVFNGEMNELFTRNFPSPRRFDTTE